MIEYEKPVADAIAAKALTVDGIRSASSLGTEGLSAHPGVLVLVPESRVTERTGSSEAWEFVYPGFIVVEPNPDPERALAKLAGLAGKMRAAWLTGIKLGLAYVQDSYVRSFVPELLNEGAEDDEWPAMRFEIVVTVREMITRTA
jgi:hypothetical protein